MSDSIKAENGNWEIEKPTTDEMAEFYLPQAVNDGVKFMLTNAKGEETEHWLLVRGRWSDAYQNAVMQSNVTRGREIRLSDDKRTPENVIRVREQASLVAGWSFAQECTPENVAALFMRNPKLADSIETLAWNESRFFDK